MLSGTLPSWLSDLIENSSFLLPFDLRRYLFYITAFDRQRALAKFVERNPDHDMSSSRRLNSERSSREKKVVDRSRILQDAEQLLNKTKNSNAYIEVQYSDEVGTGLGPTLEFYTLVNWLILSKNFIMFSRFRKRFKELNWVCGVAIDRLKTISKVFLPIIFSWLF